MNLSIPKCNSCRGAILLCISYCVANQSIVAHEPSKAESQPKVRKYEDGPLTPDDFQGQRPEDVSDDEAIHDAFIRTQLKYEIRYEVQTNGKTTTVKLESINAYAVIDQNNSWNLRKDDAELLDHEQGHFDLTHATALRIEIQLRGGIKSRQPLTTKAETQEAAIKELDRKIMEVVDRLSKDEVKTQLEYDRLTEHGRLPEPQAELRKQQKQLIVALTEQLKRVTRK